MGSRSGRQGLGHLCEGTKIFRIAQLRIFAESCRPARRRPPDGEGREPAITIRRDRQPVAPPHAPDAQLEVPKRQLVRQV